MDKPQRWIFIRGLMRGQGHWGDFPEQFKKHFPTAEIEFLDLPGNGSRHRELSPINVAAYVEALRKESQFVKNKQPFQILAVSLGGMVATLWQDLYPDEVEQFFLINTSFRNLPPWKRFRLKNLPLLLKFPFLSSGIEKEKLVTGIICNNDEVRKSILPKLASYTEQTPLRYQNFIRQLIAAALVKFPKNPKKNVVIMGAKGDRLVSVECTEKLARFWKKEAQIHPWGGHDLPIDDAEWVLRILKSHQTHTP